MAVSPKRAAQALVARAAQEQAELERRRGEILSRVPSIVRILRERFGAARAVLFGSLVWGGFHDRSDVDLAVEGLAAERVGEAMAEASERAGCVVEIFRLEDLSRSFRERILSAGEPIA